MALDPYELCPCGSGQKVKWCCGKALPQIEKIIALIRNNQAENAIKAIDRLGSQEASPAFVATLRVQALASFGKEEEAFISIEKTIEEYPDYGLARQVRSEFLYAQQDFAEALDGFRDAVAHYPQAATDHLSQTFLKIGNCHHYQGRPLAAWAAWQQAVKIDPSCSEARESIEKYTHENSLLTNQARNGLTLKSPDELVVFNEEIRAKWDQAIAESDGWQLEDVAAVFEYLANDDVYDLAAWYNLAVVSAWIGENARAIEAMEHYVKYESDFEAAADAWDLCEILRMGVGAEEYSDNMLHVTVYQIGDPKDFLERLKNCKNIMVIQSEGNRSLHWMDKEPFSADSGIPVLGGPPKQIAQLNLLPSGVELVSNLSENLLRVREEFKRLMGGMARPIGDYQRTGTVRTLDVEPFYTFISKDDENRDSKLRESVQRYFEEDWIRRPLRSLAGAEPIDAAQSPDLRKNLEGIVRFRERLYERYDAPYDFDRLRNKLGLEISGGTDLEGKPRQGEISSYSAAQLSELDPAALDDGDLLIAYRTALGLDARTTVLGFAQQMIQRDSLASQIDMSSVFHRLISEKLESGKPDQAAKVLQTGIEYDRRLTDSEHKNRFEVLRARCELAGGKTDSACELFRKLFERQPDDLKLIADAVENLLSAGAYEPALEFAERGRQRAEELHSRDREVQFREYLQEASTRAI